MAYAVKVIRNRYRDSVALMQLSTSLAGLAGIERASAIMATQGNLALLRDAGLLERAVEARPSDLLIALQGDGEAALAAAMESAEQALKQEARDAIREGAHTSLAPRSIEMACAADPEANVALISVPGEYAFAEAAKALQLGLHVMLFSDNVTLEDEIELKTLGWRRKLLVMGPDCGTAIVNGVPLGFANVVRRGSVGCIGASGTGLQQVTCLVDRLGCGVSHAIGTGSRDLHERVGGSTMLQAIRLLAADQSTKVIVLVSKPPSARVADRVLDAARKVGKPVVVNFIGANPATIRGENLHPVGTLEETALAAVALARGRKPRRKGSIAPPRVPWVPAPGQVFVRGLYSGGTFCYEASYLLGEALGRVWSNASVSAEHRLEDAWHSRGHSLIDLGDDVFTRGRPHPMIDHRLRNERLLIEAGDPEVAVILFDVVLGHGAHPNPAAAIAPAIRDARAATPRRNRRVAFVGFVCGTGRDPQDLARQEALLRKAGVLLAGSNAEAVRIAAAIAAKARRANRHGSRKTVHGRPAR